MTEPMTETDFEDDDLDTIKDARTNAPIEAMASREADAAAMAEIFAASTVAGSGAMQGASALKRREIAFVIDGSVGMLRADGAPVFSDIEGNILDVRITIRSLSFAEEKGVLKGIMDNPALLPFELAKASLFKIAGERINAAKRDWLWEVLGPAGRSLCVVAYNMIGGASNSVMGKYRASISIG